MSCGPAGPQPKGCTRVAQQCSSDDTCRDLNRRRQGQRRRLTLFDLISQWTRSRPCRWSSPLATSCSPCMMMFPAMCLQPHHTAYGQVRASNSRTAAAVPPAQMVGEHATASRVCQQLRKHHQPQTSAVVCRGLHCLQPRQR